MRITILRKYHDFIDGQYRRPSGVVGRWIGSRMARQHLPENDWTVAQLDAQPTDHILEVGFGPGLAIQLLAAKVTHGRVAGIDFSRAMLNAARQRNAALIHAGRVDLRLGSVEQLPFADATFDKAFGIHTIYFWRQPLEALKELRRVLKPGGTLTITVLPKEKWNLQNPEAVIGTPDCTPYLGSDIAQMLIAVGFSTTRIAQDTDPAKPSNFAVIGIK